MFESLEAWQFAFVALNLIILYFFLRKFLFKRVTDFMDNRTNSIQQAIDNAEKDRAQAEALIKEYEEQLKTAREQADKILSDAHARASKEYDSILASAKTDGQAVMEKAREEIEREREQMLKDIKNQVAGLALAAASKVIEANMDNERNRALVDKFIDEEGVA
jgi:F-type H+-transporting ATPase subunit b